jgi:hypothetical protein
VTTDGPTGPHGGPSCDGGTPSEGTDPMGRLDPRIGTPEGPGSPGPTSRYGRLGDRPEARRRVRSPGVPVPHQLEGRVLGPEPTAGTVTRRSAARFVRLGGQQRIAAVDRTPDGPVTTHSSQTRDARSISASPAAPGRHGETRRGHATEGGPGHGDREPHGREWLKHVTGYEEEQTVKVVRNGEGGPKRVWKPATRSPDPGSTPTGRRNGVISVVPSNRRGGPDRIQGPGSVLLVLGASQGRKNLKRGGPETRAGRSRPNRKTGREDGRDPRGRAQGHER